MSDDTAKQGAMLQLEVWMYGAQVGTLIRVEGRMSFAYRSEWLDRATNDNHGLPIALSQSLPLQLESFDDRMTRPFFEGLLPEGHVRKAVAHALQVSRQNEFALLAGIGGECAGAVTLLPPGMTPSAMPLQDGSSPAMVSALVRWMDDAQLLTVLDEMPMRPMRVGDDGLRMSLAGAQDKLPVVAESVAVGEGHDGQRVRIGLPLLGTPSTHILKPAITGADGSVFNEGFCMALAGALKLDVAKTRIHRIQDRHYLLVERYDRKQLVGDHRIHRIHQEDFCQALGTVSSEKYQNEGGPSAGEAFALVRQATRPSAPQTLRLLDAFVFNALVGNNDAHGKNFSLLYAEQGTVLAPLYDLLCTAVYPQFSEKMAMKIGSKYRFTEVFARHWRQFAADAGLSPAQTVRRVLEMARRLPPLATDLVSEFEGQGLEHAVLGQIVTTIEQRCELTVRRLTETGKEAAEEGDG